MRKIVMASIAGATIAAAVLAPGASAGPGTTVIYDSTPNPLPPNVHSFGPEAYSFAEMGDEVSFAGTARTLSSVTLIMSSWACENGHWFSGDCSTTTPGATYSVPITFNIYSVGDNNAPAEPPIASLTHTFDIPFRPSADPACATKGFPGKWLASDGNCYNGFAAPITFNFPATSLPGEVIYGIAFNTTHNGYAPVGESAPCYSSSGGCGYDSLNIGWQDQSVPSTSVGSDVDPSQFWVDQPNTPTDCSSTPGTLSPEANTCSRYGETVPATPAVQFNAVTPGPACPTSGSTNLANQTVNGNLTVPAGQTYCLDHSTVTGDITVSKGASLIMIDGSTGGHDVKGSNVNAVTIDSSTVNHDVNFTGATGPISVTNSKVLHDLNLTGNKGGVTVSSNTIGHDLNVKTNTGGTTVTGNSVSHVGNCSGNVPFSGTGNSATAASCNTA